MYKRDIRLFLADIEEFTACLDFYGKADGS